jgi:hypothetical protein
VLALALIAGLCGLATLGAIFVVITGHRLGIHGAGGSRLVAAALLASYPLTFLVVFLHVAMAAAAGARLEGSRLGIGEALGAANQRAIAVALWALVVFGFGLLLRVIGALLPDGLDLAVWPLDFLWALATVFVVPLLALEDSGIRKALGDSRTLLQRGWGEALTGILAIGLLTLLLVLPAFLLLLGGIAVLLIAPSGSFILIAAGLAGIVVIRSLTGALQQVFAVELYRFAASENHVEGTVV